MRPNVEMTTTGEGTNPALRRSAGRRIGQGHNLAWSRIPCRRYCLEEYAIALHRVFDGSE